MVIAAIYLNAFLCPLGLLAFRCVLRSYMVWFWFLGRKEWVWGEAPIHRAAAIGRTDILKVLIDAGGSLKSYSIHDNDDKLTCLHLAGRLRLKFSYCSDNKYVQYPEAILILQYLWWISVWCNQAEMVKLLLQMGADPNLPGTCLDYNGTPWDFALQYKNAEILEIFKEFDKTGKVRHPGQLPQ